MNAEYTNQNEGTNNQQNTGAKSVLGEDIGNTTKNLENRLPANSIKCASPNIFADQIKLTEISFAVHNQFGILHQQIEAYLKGLY